MFQQVYPVRSTDYRVANSIPFNDFMPCLECSISHFSYDITSKGSSTGHWLSSGMLESKWYMHYGIKEDIYI